MGIQLGALKFKGKFNDSVGFTNGNAKSEATRYAVRNRVTQVSNPKTSGQAGQRVKLAPAQNLYRALADLLDHSWEGVKYGGRSYSEFLKRAMLMQNGFPWVVKGEKMAYPGEYVIADGSLAPITPSVSDVMARLYADSLTDISSTPTMGELASALIAAGLGLQNGDQLTFVTCYISPDCENQPIWNYDRIILNTADTDTLDDFNGLAGRTIYFEKYNNALLIKPNAFSSNDSFVAAAIIVSRPPRNAGGAWLRSYSKIVCSDSYKAQYINGDLKMHQAIISYMLAAKTAAESDRYLNEGGDNTPENPLQMVTISVQQVPANAGATITGAGTYVVGSNVSLLVEEEGPDYSFQEWQDEDGNTLTSAAELDITATTSKVYKAVFMGTTPP